MYKDYLADLGLTTGKQSEGVENIILDYIIDATSTGISLGNIVSFVGNNVRKMQNGDSPRGIAITSGAIGDTIKVQLMGIVKLKDYFTAGANYFNTATGELNNVTITPTTTLKHIGIAISKDELLVKRGAFIYV